MGRLSKIKDSWIFKKILQAVIQIGNLINKDTNHGRGKKEKLLFFLLFYKQLFVRREKSGESDEDYYKALSLKVIYGTSNEIENMIKLAGLDMDIVTSIVEHLLFEQIVNICLAIDVTR